MDTGRRPIGGSLEPGQEGKPTWGHSVHPGWQEGSRKLTMQNVDGRSAGQPPSRGETEAGRLHGPSHPKTPDPPEAHLEPLVATHHLEHPKEGREVAGLSGIQLEEVHGDDGEHDQEQS